jgi:hypothetical protein
VPIQALVQGPIAVAVMADDDWFSYSGGVYSSNNCGGEVNHAVLVVGAGVDDFTAEPYWLIRNSWGDQWGEGGHIRHVGQGMIGSDVFRGTVCGARVRFLSPAVLSPTYMYA